MLFLKLRRTSEPCALEKRALDIRYKLNIVGRLKVGREPKRQQSLVYLKLLQSKYFYHFLEMQHVTVFLMFFELYCMNF